MQVQASFLRRRAASRLMVALFLGTAIGAPVTVDFSQGGMPALSPAFAQARGGDDSGGGDDNGGDRGGDRGGDDNGGGRGGDDNGGHGRGGDDNGGDDSGGRGRGGDDNSGDDNGGRGRGGDDRGGDDRGGRGRGGDDTGRDDHGRGRGHDDDRKAAGGVGTIGAPTGGVPTRAERSAQGIEVTYADGWREEVENGRYELKDAQNRTVVERSATRQDYDRLGAIAR